MTSASARIGRRAVLGLGGGLIALAVGVGTGILSRRSTPIGPDAATSSTGSAPGPNSTVHEPPSTTNDEPISNSNYLVDVESNGEIGPAAELDTAETQALLVASGVTPGVLAVGRAYLRDVPEEANMGVLLARLPVPDGDVVAAARSRVATDFGARHTVSVDGWVLARSEARAAALLSLACPDGC